MLFPQLNNGWFIVCVVKLTHNTSVFVFCKLQCCTLRATPNDGMVLKCTQWCPSIEWNILRASPLPFDTNNWISSKIRLPIGWIILTRKTRGSFIIKTTQESNKTRQYCKIKNNNDKRNLHQCKNHNYLSFSQTHSFFVSSFSDRSYLQPVVRISPGWHMSLTAGEPRILGHSIW